MESGTGQPDWVWTPGAKTAQFELNFRPLEGKSCLRMRFQGTLDSEWVYVMCPGGTSSKFRFQNTCGKAKSDLQNRFKREIAMLHFFGAPCMYFSFWFDGQVQGKA